MRYVLKCIIQFYLDYINTWKKNERDKLPVRWENERKLMRSNNYIIKEIEITSFRGRRVYRDMHIVICIHLSTDAFCTWPLRALSAKSTKSFITHEVVPDINWHDSTCRQFFLGIKYFRVT